MDQAPTDHNAELQSEFQRLTDKLGEAHDPDIQRVLQARIDEIQAELSANIGRMKATAHSGDSFDVEAKHAAEDQVRELQGALIAQAETISPTPTPAEEAQLRQELTRTSGQLYSTEDPQKRAELQARVKELQGLLGIDVANLAGKEMSQNAIPDPVKVAKPQKDQPKQRVELADLQALVAEKSAQIRKAENQTEIDLPENPEPPTPEAMAAAEKLIQQARVEKMRGNSQEVRRLLEQALQIAPGSPTVLEMVGDDFAERKQSGRALAYYRRAAKLDPKNVNLERKVALSALGMNALSSEAQASPGGPDDSAIPMASRKAALVISLFLPGLGHVVLGEKVKGGVFIAIWCLSLAWVILMSGDIAKLIASFSGGRSQANMIVVVPLFLMVVVYLGSLMSLKAPEETLRMPADRPRPPVDLPFE